VATKVATIKLTDLTKAIDKATAGFTGKKIPGGIIMGRVAPPKATDAEIKAMSAEITKAVATMTGLKIKPGVYGGTMGFIFRPEDLGPLN
jgi:hypothetical protein